MFNTLHNMWQGLWAADNGGDLDNAQHAMVDSVPPDEEDLSQESVTDMMELLSAADSDVLTMASLMTSPREKVLQRKRNRRQTGQTGRAGERAPVVLIPPAGELSVLPPGIWQLVLSNLDTVAAMRVRCLCKFTKDMVVKQLTNLEVTDTNTTSWALPWPLFISLSKIRALTLNTTPTATLDLLKLYGPRLEKLRLVKHLDEDVFENLALLVPSKMVSLALEDWAVSDDLEQHGETEHASFICQQVTDFFRLQSWTSLIHLELFLYKTFLRPSQITALIRALSVPIRGAANVSGRTLISQLETLTISTEDDPHAYPAMGNVPEVSAYTAVAGTALANAIMDSPYPLRLKYLSVALGGFGYPAETGLFQSLYNCPSLTSLEIGEMGLGLDPGAIVELTRVIKNLPKLRKLEVGSIGQVFDTDAELAFDAHAFCAALAECPYLTSLSIHCGQGFQAYNDQDFIETDGGHMLTFLEAISERVCPLDITQPHLDGWIKTGSLTKDWPPQGIAPPLCERLREFKLTGFLDDEREPVLRWIEAPYDKDSSDSEDSEDSDIYTDNEDVALSDLDCNSPGHGRYGWGRWVPHRGYRKLATKEMKKMEACFGNKRIEWS